MAKENTTACLCLASCAPSTIVGFLPQCGSGAFWTSQTPLHVYPYKIWGFNTPFPRAEQQTVNLQAK